MSGSLRGIPPRVQLRLRDDRGGRSPTVSRTVSTSDRTGAHALTPFDDTRTLVFTSSLASAADAATGVSPVLEPLMLWRGVVDGGRTPSIIDLARATGTIPFDLAGLSGLSNTLSVVAGVADAFLEQSEDLETHRPYVEDRQYEQGNTSSFFATGTDPVVVGPGFSTPLSSKTQVKLRLRHDTKYEFPASTASIAYYSFSSGCFGRVGTVTNPSDAYCYISTGVVGFPLVTGSPPATAAGMNWAYDARLFGPLGNIVVSGTSRTASSFFNCPSPYVKQFVSASLASTLSTTNNESVTVNPLFAANRDEVIVLDEVQQPFLVEKVVVELPLSASAGWLDDTTTLWLGSVSGGVANVDIGGPCITVSLLNQMCSTHREVVFSGTIVPIADATGSFLSPGGTIVPYKFGMYSKPTATVSGTGGVFRGTVRLDITPSTSNGVFAVQDKGSADPITFDRAAVYMFDSFGRALKSEPSGRSFFGKEFVIPQRDKPYVGQSVLPIGESSARPVLYFFQESAPAPYIVMPGDRLVLAVSKHRSVATVAADTLTTGSANRALLSASHQVAIDVGVVEVTLYGSLIKSQTEFQFGRNEPLTSYAVGEALSFDNAVLDQFDVAHRSSFSGTYIDDIVAGTFMTSSDGSGPDDASSAEFDVTFRRVVESTVAGPMTASSRAFNRFVKLRTTDEVFFDSFAPPAIDIQTIDSASVLYTTALLSPSNNAINVIPLRPSAHVPEITASPNSASVENSKWPLGYPFEPRYGALSRRLSFANDKLRTSTFFMQSLETTEYDIDELTKLQKTSPIEGIMRVDIRNHETQYVSSSLEFLLNSVSTVYWGRELITREFNKGFFGFGDADNNQPMFGGPQKYIISGANHAYSAAHLAMIRGWKYGLLDGNPRTSMHVLRRDRYGQFRDTLEQGWYTKYIRPGAVAAVSPVSVRFTSTNPADTVSSNLSFEATSSLPYFDGVARNRGDLPDTEVVEV